jgi:hypothetical protein
MIGDANEHNGHTLVFREYSFDEGEHRTAGIKTARTGTP